MPLYEYHCHECGHHFERIERASAMHDGVCPSCGGAAQRLLGAPALKFKGSGWYVTDYGKGDGSQTKPSETKAETKTETGSETPPAAKKDSKHAESAGAKVA